MSQNIWLARHGLRLDFVNWSWFDEAEHPYDPPLAPEGEQQALSLANRLKSENIRHIFASPFLRTVQTAQIVSNILNLSVKIEWGLSEWLNPDWMTAMPETTPVEILQKNYPGIDLNYVSRIQPEYPETELKLRERTAKTINQILTEFSEDILIIGHSPSIIAIGLALNPILPKIKPDFACLMQFTKTFLGWEIKLNGDTTHLN